VGDITYAERAARAHAALERHFRREADRSLYAETERRTDDRWAFVWPFSQIVAAAGDVYERLGGPRRKYRRIVHDGFANYWDDTATPPAYSPSVVPPYVEDGERYYDDNAWVGLELIRAYRLLGDQSLLDAARAVFTFVAAGWDGNETHAYPGGVFWVDNSENRDRNVVSNAPNAQLALALNAITGDRMYLEWAQRVDRWVDSALRDPADGLYWDHVALDGAIDTTKWSYCQGSVVGMKLLLGEVEAAEAIARTALDHFARVGFLTQSPVFNAIFFRNVVALERVRTNAVDALRDYAEAAWSSYRTDDDLFCVRAGQPAQVIDQAAAVQIYALAS
jgi:uncharacterized protein YyaL (SSP411 family)